MSVFPRRTASEIQALSTQVAIDDETLQQAREIVEMVKHNGDIALRQLAQKFDDLPADASLIIKQDELELAYNRVDVTIQSTLKNTCQRIQEFAAAQLGALSEVSVPVPGGKAGHTIEPICRAGCYAPGGRFPLPSSVLMTAGVAKVAGCPEIVVASPNPSDLVKAAAFVAGATQLIPVGGAQAIGALAFGTETIGAVDMIAGPGNRWVTAAKQLVFGRVGVDMLAGPSELLVLADETANPSHIATDLLAQAEHDLDARTFLVSLDASLVDRVELEIETQLQCLSTAEIASQSLNNGGSVVVNDLAEAIQIVEKLSPEHLEIQCCQARQVARQIKNAGCVFVGPKSAEVFGDYGIGPNHTLPTGTTARFRGGLSVFDFVRIRSWIELEQTIDKTVQNEMAKLAELEGLKAHQRAVKIDR